ncbi:MAG: nickel pincer cofactor biosynthesis protein LarB, partial [Deltaproteobacteria bacterium]|nr:nickel pincer cofactor biosynthesis protein LarB [Deltaproteobacteria bacterium]
MDREIIKDLLDQLRKGEVSVDDVMKALKDLPFEDIGVACIDHHRGLRRGLSEVIFGEGKEADQILAIMERMARQDENIMATRLSREKAGIIREAFPDSVYHERARVLTLTHHAVEAQGRGTILVITAGTSDIPVAEEAAITARFMGNDVTEVFDVGVAGLHRVLSHKEQLDSATVIIVVAGMEGALPSVVGGLVDKPVIAVPTSVGYGASFGVVTALLGMLNSCASGVTVVNIDNGFGAGYAA